MNALDEVASIAADLRAWLEWQDLLGASALPRESIGSVPAGERTVASPRITHAQKATAHSEPVRRASKVMDNARAKPPVKPPAVASTGLSDKWKALMEEPTSHRIQGPAGTDLMIVRGSGSSPEAESMLDRMLENVLGVSRAQVCIVDLIRDTREPQIIGAGFLDALPALQPRLILLMGRFAVQAIYGDTESVQGQRTRWHSLACGDEKVPLRVTHHPEAILLLAGRGQTAPKREAFADLRAVQERLTSV